MELESIKCLQKYYELYDNTISKCSTKECEEKVTELFINGIFRIMSASNKYDKYDK